MAYDRNEGRRPSRDHGRDPRSRFSEDRFDRDERGFFERAGDEISSWFGDDEAERRRRPDDRAGDDRFGPAPRGRYEEDQGAFDRSARVRDEGNRRPYTGRSTGRPESGGSDYRPMTGDYGRAAERDRSSFSGMAPTSGRAGDPHYSEWRQRQIDSLDRDYEDYRRENQSKFDSDFSSWRSTRQSKRQLLGQVREQMQVVGSDEQPVGTVDKLRGDRIILTRNDSPDGQHHALGCALIDRVEGDRVILDKPADEALKSLSSETRDRALFEREDSGEPGAHILNRSFSGTY